MFLFRLFNFSYLFLFVFPQFWLESMSLLFSEFFIQKIYRIQEKEKLFESGGCFGSSFYKVTVIRYYRIALSRCEIFIKLYIYILSLSLVEILKFTICYKIWKCCHFTLYLQYSLYNILHFAFNIHYTFYILPSIFTIQHFTFYLQYSLYILHFTFNIHYTTFYILLLIFTIHFTFNIHNTTFLSCWKTFTHTINKKQSLLKCGN